MKKIISITCFLLLAGIMGCHSGSENTGAFNAGSEPEMIRSVQDEMAAPIRKVITEGTLEFATSNVAATRQRIVQAMEKSEAYTSSDQEYKSPGRLSVTMVIRVPSKNFNTLLSEIIKGVEHFDQKRIEVKDVTEEFLDIQARLKTMKEMEERYLHLLQETNTVMEILEIEKQIGRLRADIESIEGRLKYLENRIDYSTLTTTFYQKVPLKTEFSQKFRIGFRNGWDNLVWFFVFLTHIWPFILIIGGSILAYKIWKKRIVKKP